MTTPLEIRYRRLLAIYPSEHRRAYEEEMVGVLMEGARPDQRRPALGEAVDLLWAGFVTRLGRGAQGLRNAAWRDAAAVAGLLVAAVLTAVACRRLILGLQIVLSAGDPMRDFGVDGGLLIDVALRSVAWLAVTTVVLAGARRTAVVLGAVAVLVEIGAIVAWTPAQEFRALHMSWAPALGLLAVAFLVLARRGRTAVAVLSGPGVLLAAGGIVLAAAASSVWRWLPNLLPDALALGGLAVVVAGVWMTPGETRRRILVLLAPAFALPLAQWLLEEAIQIELAPVVTPGMVVAQVLLMVGVPLAALAVAAAALHARERVEVSVSVSVTRKPAEEAD
jgi:hypothetical protein